MPPKRASRNGSEPSLLTDMFGHNFLGALLTYLGVLVLVVLLVLLIAQRFVVLAVIPLVLVIRLFLPWFVVARRDDRPADVYYGKAQTWFAASRLIRTVEQEIRVTGAPASLTPAREPARRS